MVGMWIIICIDKLFSPQFHSLLTFTAPLSTSFDHIVSKQDDICIRFIALNAHSNGLQLDFVQLSITSPPTYSFPALLPPRSMHADSPHLPLMDTSFNFASHNLVTRSIHQSNQLPVRFNLRVLVLASSKSAVGYVACCSI